MIYYFPKQRTWWTGFLLIVVNCCVACRAAMCVGYMKCRLSLTCSVWCSLSVRTTLQSVPKYLVWFMLIVTELHRTKFWCWVVIKAVGCRPMRFLFKHNRSVLCWILIITLQCKRQAGRMSAANMSVVLMPILLKLFSIFWTHKVHYYSASVRLSVCLYVTRWHCVKTTQATIMRSSR